MALPTPLLLLSILLSLLPSSPSAATSILVTGDPLPRNLALQNPSLLRRRSQLLVQTPNGSTVFSSPPPADSDGLYAALLRSDGRIAIYGPSLWSTPRRRSGGVAEMAERWPTARSHMFSSQVLYDNARLASGGHALVMTGDCSLELVEASGEVVWESGTKGRGGNCFARLDHRGQLAVVDDRLRVVWASPAGEADGFYVLVVQSDGRAAVYGPAVWSTNSP